MCPFYISNFFAGFWDNEVCLEGAVQCFGDGCKVALSEIITFHLIVEVLRRDANAAGKLRFGEISTLY